MQFNFKLNLHTYPLIEFNSSLKTYLLMFNWEGIISVRMKEFTCGRSFYYSLLLAYKNKPPKTSPNMDRVFTYCSSSSKSALLCNSSAIHSLLNKHLIKCSTEWLIWAAHSFHLYLNHCWRQGTCVHIKWYRYSSVIWMWSDSIGRKGRFRGSLLYDNKGDLLTFGQFNPPLMNHLKQQQCS